MNFSRGLAGGYNFCRGPGRWLVTNGEQLSDIWIWSPNYYSLGGVAPPSYTSLTPGIHYTSPGADTTYTAYPSAAAAAAAASASVSTATAAAYAAAATVGSTPGTTYTSYTINPPTAPPAAVVTAAVAAATANNNNTNTTYNYVSGWSLDVLVLDLF